MFSNQTCMFTDSPGAHGEDLVLLFDLESDPYERQNIAAANPEIVNELLGALINWEQEMASPLWPPVMHFRMEVWGRPYWFAI